MFLKKVICILSFFSFLPMSIAATDGFIVKLKRDAQLSKNFKIMAKQNRNLEDLNLTSGDFFKLNTLGNPSKSDLSHLVKHPAVEYISPNFIYSFVKADGEKRDPKFKKQWGLKNKRRPVDINAINAWKITKGSKRIIIAVIDTGVDYNHSDLKGNIWANEAELYGVEGVDDDKNGFVDDIHGYDFYNNDADPMDDHGHGTHCAGVIGAVHNNSIGIKGVMAYVRILPLKFLGKKGQGDTAAAIRSIDYAIKAGAHVMSNSWGGGEADHDPALKDLISEANDKGVVFVAAAGNNYGNNDVSRVYPATYNVDNIVSVGSITKRGKKSSFSNYGAKSVHIFAPGSKIYSTVINNKYKNMSGTSMAAPHVSGVIGLLLSQDSELTPLEVRERVIATAKKSKKLKRKCVAEGWIDAEGLLLNSN